MPFKFIDNNNKLCFPCTIMYFVLKDNVAGCGESKIINTWVFKNLSSYWILSFNTYWTLITLRVVGGWRYGGLTKVLRFSSRSLASWHYIIQHRCTRGEDFSTLFCFCLNSHNESLEEFVDLLIFCYILLIFPQVEKNCTFYYNCLRLVLIKHI